MRLLHLFVVGFGRPDLLRQQVRLLDEYLLDPFDLMVLDNTSDPRLREAMKDTALDLGVSYRRVVSEKHEHPDALTRAAGLARRGRYAYWGCLDHDIMPARSVRILDTLERVGFHGLGQTYSPRVGSPLRYLWPGWIFFSRRWLNGRIPNFYGIRGEHAFDNGDAGSLLHTLFSEDDWARLVHVEHSYGVIRDDDGHGLQSYGYELVDGWLHFTNASHWKDVPDVEERDRLLREMVDAL